jgi:FkbM family methyltransferase
MVTRSSKMPNYVIAIFNRLLNKASRSSTEYIRIKTTCEAQEKQLEDLKCFIYHAVLSSHLLDHRKLRIAVVGANDGVVNDPIFPWIRGNALNTEIYLIEPQQKLRSILENNYEFHPSSHILSCAIGPRENSSLFSLKQEYWSDYKPFYSKGWPAYRAALGLTSASREHVEKHVRGFIKDADIEQAIEEETVEFMPLHEALIKHKLPPEIDILQIDAEGHDDTVVYNSSLDLCKPKVVYLEVAHMPQDRRSLMGEYLKGHGYRIYDINGDWLCIKTPSSVEPVSSLS